MTAATRSVRANGIRVAYLEDGPAGGPLVVLLHGFPDNARSWERQIPALAAAGYRVVAPWLRGYPPTEIPARGYYDRATLATDVKGLVDAINGGRPCLLVGQDWGAAIGYGVLAAYPQLVRRAVLLAVPHPAEVRATLRKSPKHAIRSFHWFLFQLPAIPEWLCRANDGAFLETLWKLWSPRYDDRAHVAEVRRAMREPGALEASLAYYRAMFGARNADPALAAVRERFDSPIRVPTLVLCGSRDMRREMLEPQRRFFAGEYAWATVDGAGHFLHREQPDEVNRRILGWLSRDGGMKGDYDRSRPVSQ
jgi:pimeloyl-ACP methyl ester carboxylesterase